MYDNQTILDELFKNESKQAATAVEADEILAVVDRSGSMESIREDAQGGLNSFIREQQEIGEANFTLVEFDDIISLVCERVNIKNVKPYELRPGNYTALYDAIGKTLRNAESITTTGQKIVVIVTDGGENASREYSQAAIFSRIESLKEKGWKFIFLAANQDAMKTGTSLGISAGSTIQYDANSIGATAVYAAASNYTRSLRSGFSLAEAEAQLTNTIATTAGLSRTDVVSVKPGEQAISGQGVAGPVDMHMWTPINAEDAEDCNK